MAELGYDTDLLKDNIQKVAEQTVKLFSTIVEHRIKDFPKGFQGKPFQVLGLDMFIQSDL
jgi:hypothetical protein